jgi:ABC-type branched-subunit amino acid transport system permease subunit
LWGVLVGAAFVELLPVGLSTWSVAPSAAVPVIFGAVVVAVMAVLPLGAADLLRPVLQSRGNHGQHPDTPRGTEAR